MYTSAPPPSVFPPVIRTVPPPRPSAGVAIAIIVSVLVLFGALGGGAYAWRKHATAAPSGGPGAVVRVVMKSGSGTGFFVSGPDAWAYVATAFHVVGHGEPVAIERTIEVEGTSFVEAYPDAEVVAFDSEADLAILRLKNVRADRFPRFVLAKEPKKDEDVLSYGFPESTLAKRFGMVSKPGKLLTLVKFPAYDHDTKTLLKNEAVDGLLVSTEIEPGFSGGPTCNARGEVVGVNVTKDLVHRGQNGAVNVAVLAKLLASVKPKAEERAPTTEEVKALLTKIEQQYLLLPVDKRMATPVDDIVTSTDLPRIDALATEVRKLENDASTDPKTQLSGRAMLGLTLLRLPGRPLETYLAPSTRHTLATCEERERGLREFFGKLVPSKELGVADEAARAKCLVLAARPLAWDLTALAMQWEGKERTATVSRVETIDAERHLHRASVKFGGLDHLADVWVSSAGGRLRLEVFDDDGKPIGLDASRNVPAASFQGTWHRSEPRAAQDFAKEFGHEVDADAETDETVTVAVDSRNAVTITHVVKKHVTLRGGLRLACGGANGASLELGLEQTFAGQLVDGSVMAASVKTAKPVGADMTRCASLLHYRPDRMVALKRVDGALVMVRTDGTGFPEAAELTR